MSKNNGYDFMRKKITINHLFKKFIKNENIHKWLEHTSLIDLTIQSLPSKFYSKHQNIITDYQPNLFNFLILLCKVIYFLIKYFFVRNDTKEKSKFQYDTLLFIPNSKFLPNFDVLKEGLNDFKTISISDIEISNNLNLKKYIPNKFSVLCRFFLIMFVYSFTILKDKVELKKLINNLISLQKLVYNVLILDEFFKKYSFRNYFSLMPNIDHHFIIETFFSEQFDNTFAIRTTTTTRSNEHRYIKTQNLFYKSDFEKLVYKELLENEKIRLIPSSLILKQNHQLLKDNYKKIPFNVLFLDTCLSKSKARNHSREIAIESYYNFMSHYNKVRLYHKFHPALDSKNKRSIIKSHSDVIYIDDDDQDYLSNIDLIVGFYSTVLQTGIIHKIPIILISFAFNLEIDYLSENRHELEQSPIYIVKNSAELSEVITLIYTTHSPYNNLLKTRELYDYYTNLYNYPKGLESMFEVLNQ